MTELISASSSFKALDDWNPDTSLTPGQLVMLKGELAEMLDDIEMRVESYEEMFRAYDERGWNLLQAQNFESGKGVSLNELVKLAKVNQQLLINPQVKRGIRIRVSYVFGEGVKFGTATAPATGGRVTSTSKFIKNNAATVFSKQAGEELETALCTDGNLFLLLDKKNKRIIRIPMVEITGVYTSKSDVERKLYIKRTWLESKSGVVGDPVTESKSAWYPVAGVSLEAGEKVPNGTKLGIGTSDEAQVDNDMAILHVAVNKQLGWNWGMGDIQPVVFWTKAYKEYLESQYLIVRALSRFVFKISSSTVPNAKRAAAKVAALPMTDANGRPMSSGGTAVTAGGDDLVAINKAGANVNFEAGRPLAAMVAAGLEVSLEHLLSDPSVKSVGEETLSVPTAKAMASRQSLFRDMYLTIFEYFGISMSENEIIFPPIQTDPIHRVIQAIVTAASTNGLHPEEIRDMLVLTLRLYGINPLDKLPKAGAYQEFVTGLNAKEQADKALAAKQPPGADGGTNKNPGTSPQDTPDASGGKRSPAGALADGDHEMRKSESDGGLGLGSADVQALIASVQELIARTEPAVSVTAGA